MIEKDLDPRNKEIRKRRRNGETLASIGKDHELTRERIRQICIGIPKPFPGYIRRAAKSSAVERNTKQTKAIYGIYADDESLPRYVGQSPNPRNRLMGHIASAKSSARLYRIDLPDTVFRVETLEEVESNKASEREVHWINKFRKMGAVLANSQLAVGKYRKKQSA